MRREEGGAELGNAEEKQEERTKTSPVDNALKYSIKGRYYNALCKAVYLAFTQA